jgi:hypothetical protein
VYISLTTAGGTSAVVTADRFTYVAAPTITAVSPSAGPTAGGTTVTITGTNFTGATAVKFGSTAATSFTVNSATSITATAPSGAAGIVNITVTTAGGTSTIVTADQFTYVAAPTITGVSPSAGPTAGGTSVTITGSGFSGATAVTFGGIAATSFTVNTAMSITATSPGGDPSTVDITITTVGGTSTIGNADQFTYLAAPIVLSVSPSAGPTVGGTTVTITGTSFTGATAVTFGGIAASFTVNSDTSISATSPGGAAGTVHITVTTPLGTTATSNADQFTYDPVPSITSISPSAGPTVGGTSVTITGSGFTAGSAVLFGGTPASSVIVNSATSITATSPGGAAGIVHIAITTAGGTSATSNADQFTYVPIPNITGISPSAGPTAGGTVVTITGSNFTGVTAVLFGSTPAVSFVVNSARSITAISPAGTGTVDVTVTSADGISPTSTADQFTFVPPPQPPHERPGILVVGTDVGPEVKVYDAGTGTPKFDFFAYDPGFTGGVRVAAGDVNGDGVPDILTVPGPGGGPLVEVFNGKDLSLIVAFNAYDPGLRTGLYVAAGDVNHDGFADIVVAPDAGGGPEVKVYSGKDLTLLLDFLAYAPGFAGGVRVAAGDTSGNGFADIITGPGIGGGPLVNIFSGQTETLLLSYNVYDTGFRGGIYVAAGDVNGDGTAEILTTPGQGGGPLVNVFRGPTNTLLVSFNAFPLVLPLSAPTSGWRAATADANGDGREEVVVGQGPGLPSEVQTYDALSLELVDDFFAYGPSFLGGVFVGG